MNRCKALAEQMIWNDEIQREMRLTKLELKKGVVDYCIQWAEI